LPKLIVSRGSGNPIRVGRDSGLEMVISHPSVSRYHLDIMTLFERHDGPRFLIKDRSGRGFGVSSPGQQISSQRYSKARAQAGALISLKEDVHMVITAPRHLRGKVREHLKFAPDILQRLETIAHRQSS